MVYTVYGDVLAAVNFIIDLALLRLTARLTHLCCRGVRPYLAAALGGAMSFLVFLPPAPLWGELLIRAASGALLVFVCFGPLPLRLFWRAAAAFLAVSVAACGMTALWVCLVPQGGWLYRNGAFYYAVSPLLLLGCIAAVYALLDFCRRLFSARAKDRDLYALTIARNGRSVTVPALADSGNRLRERFSGLPMVVLERASALPLLTAEERLYISTTLCDGLPPTLRPVVYEGVGGSGVLKAFRADGVRVREGNAEFDAYIAVTDQGFSGEYRAIFNPDLIRITL